MDTKKNHAVDILIVGSIPQGRAISFSAIQKRLREVSAIIGSQAVSIDNVLIVQDGHIEMISVDGNLEQIPCSTSKQTFQDEKGRLWSADGHAFVDATGNEFLDEPVKDKEIIIMRKKKWGE